MNIHLNIAALKTKLRKVVFFVVMTIGLFSDHTCYASESASTACSDSPTLPNAKFLGTGYDIIKGNPDGQPSLASDTASPATDPGFILVQIIEHTYNKCKIEHEYLVPDYLSYVPRSITRGECTAFAVYGSRSYEKELASNIDITGSVLFDGFRFGASAGFREVLRQQDTEYSLHVTLRTLEIYGQGRIQPGYTLNREFTSRLCSLPEKYDGNEADYHQFLETFGTHVVIGSMFGRSEHVVVQYKLATVMLREARKTSGKVSVGGRYKGFRASIDLPVSQDLLFEDLKGAPEESRTIFKKGTPENNEPLGYVLLGMDYLAQDAPCNRNGTLAQNMILALESYPKHLGITKSEDPAVFRLPLAWVDGRYTLPMSVNGCPEGDVSWAQGFRLFDTRHDNQQNKWEPDNIHLDLPIKEVSRMKMKFCTKTTWQSTDYHRDWDKGTYCIFRYGDACPIGFQDGSIFWNELTSGNDNDHEGILPDGEYTDGNTMIYFCCREDAESNKAIFLPVDHDFFLMTPSGNCQNVFGMDSSQELFHWDTVGPSEVEGLHPYPGLKNRGTLNDVEITFCYYQRQNTSDPDPDSSRSDRRRRSTTEKSHGPCSNFLDVEVPNVPGVVLPPANAPTMPTTSVNSIASSSVPIKINVMIFILYVCIAFVLQFL